MMKHNKSEIMKRAHEIRKARNISMSAALKASWRIEKGGFEMTTQELITRYDIHECFGPKAGTLAICNKEQVATDGKEQVLAEIKSRKQEILDFLRAEMAKKLRAADERKARIDAIPGLKEIRDAQDALANWRYRFNASFDGEYAVGGMGVGPRPNVDVDALKAQYPVAAAYLRMEVQAKSSNYKLAGFGNKAIDALLDGMDYTAALDQIEAEIKAYTDRHFWD